MCPSCVYCIYNTNSPVISRQLMIILGWFLGLLCLTTNSLAKRDMIYQYFSERQRDCTRVVFAEPWQEQLGSNLNEMIRVFAHSYMANFSFAPIGRWNLVNPNRCPESLLNINCFLLGISPCYFFNTAVSTTSNFGIVGPTRNVSYAPGKLDLIVNNVPFHDIMPGIWNTWISHFNVSASYMYGSVLSFFFRNLSSPLYDQFQNDKRILFRPNRTGIVVGVHIRGNFRATTGGSDARKSITKEVYIAWVDNLIKKGVSIDTVLVCSDFDFTTETFEAAFPNRTYKFLLIPRKHSLENALLDVLLLGECEALLETYSNWAVITSSLAVAKNPCIPADHICVVSNTQAYNQSVNPPCLGSKEFDSVTLAKYLKSTFREREGRSHGFEKECAKNNQILA